MSNNPALNYFPEDTLPEPDIRAQAEASAAPRERIKVVGVGGGGGNALNHIIRSGLVGVEYMAINTDVRSLDMTLTNERLMLGEKLTRGLGAGARPEVGAQAAIESREEIRAMLKGSDMVYFAAGMGGGTGTGALPVIAGIAKELGILTVSVVTRPFTFEGTKRQAAALDGIQKLEGVVDALIVVPNDRLLKQSERTTTIGEAFAMADDVLRQAIQGVTDLVMRSGKINVDFADLRTVMSQAGSAVMGVGLSKGENRSHEALRQAMESPLMESSMRGAKGVLFNVTANADISLLEIQEAANELQSQIDPDATFVWGHVEDNTMGDAVQMVVIATGFDRARNTTDSPDLDARFATVQTQGASANGSDAPQIVLPSEDFRTDGSLFTGGDMLDTPSILRRK